MDDNATIEVRPSVIRAIAATTRKIQRISKELGTQEILQDSTLYIPLIIELEKATKLLSGLFEMARNPT